VEAEAQLLDILVDAQAQGFLGPGDPAGHLSHALGFADAVLACGPPPPERFTDLGTGGGVPGLVLAALWPETHAGLIESSARRCAALRGWIEQLGLEDRVEVLEGRADSWARNPSARETFDLVTARSFARPGITAEIAAGLVRIGGLLVVSEPPSGSEERWPPDLVAELGFAPAVAVLARDAHYACLRKTQAAGDKVPRQAARLRKRPLW
jgi:16S rRNA (guanine527-N7)-methyltransferase